MTVTYDTTPHAMLSLHVNKNTHILRCVLTAMEDVTKVQLHFTVCLSQTAENMAIILC